MKKRFHILVTDDDPVARELLVEVLNKEGHLTTGAADGAESLHLARTESFDLALIDLKMPGMDGLEVLSKLRAEHPDLPVIILTAFAGMDTAVAAIRAGAFDYLSKPFSMEEIRQMVRRTLLAKQGGTRQASHRSQESGADRSNLLVGSSPVMLAVYKLIARVARSDATVLICGETGTGKEQAARAIHAASPRAQRPFVAVDCTALPETLFESELFGHERGAFTGAQAQRQGMLEMAQDGTCFLDEVGELPLALQAKLLRALQEREYRRVGGNRSLPLNARVLAATNRDLWRAVRQGDFREDLLYRLDVVRIDMPPLRARREDIPLLVQHFIDKYAGDRKDLRVSAELMEELCENAWPGNVRQLENAIQRAIAVSPSSLLLPEDASIGVPADTGEEPARISAGSLNDLKRRHIQEVLAQVDGNKQRAAQILGIDRRTLYRILARQDPAS